MNNTPNKPKKFKMHPKVVGTAYIIVGLLGLVLAVCSVFCNLLGVLPWIGTVISGAFIGALSILTIIYGCRVFDRDYTPFI
jgi:hypothetical protein